MSAFAWPYPTHDEPVHLTSGRSVQLYNLVAVTNAGGAPSLGIQYRSAVPVADATARRAEASEVITHFRALLEGMGATSASAQICVTRAQAETREPPEQIIRFRRAADGTWQETE